MSKSLKKSIISGSVWSLAGQFLIMAITLLANIILARMLTPGDFGKIGIIMFFINIAYILSEGGLSAALIRKPDATNEDYSTVFVFNFLIGFSGFLLISLFSGFISAFYKDPSLQLPLIASAFVLVVNATQFTTNTRLIAEMRYRDKSIYEFASVILSSIAGVVAAVYGLGLWSIVIMQLSRAIFITFFYSIFEKYKQSFIFSKASFKELYGFGLNTSLSSLINISFDNVYQLILGGFLSFNQVGFYYQAKKIQDVPTHIFNILSQGPVYAGLSKIQYERDRFVSAYNKISSLIMIFVGLITILFFIFSDQIMSFLFGLKWIEAGFYLKFLSVASFFFIQENVNRVIFKIFNKTKNLLLLEVIKKSFQIISIFVGIYYKDIYILLSGIIVSNLIGYLINYYFASKILNHPEYKELNHIIKVTLVILGILLVAEFVKDYYTLESYALFILFFAVVAAYIGALYLLGLIDPKKQIEEILNVIK